MIRGTTPTHIFDTDISLVSAEEIYITYVQGKTTLLEKTIDDVRVTPTTLECDLTQEETLLFAADNYKAMAQIRAVLANGKAVASNIMHFRVSPILKDGVI